MIVDIPDVLPLSFWQEWRDWVIDESLSRNSKIAYNSITAANHMVDMLKKHYAIDEETELFLMREQLSSYRPIPQWGFSSSEAALYECLRSDKVSTVETISIAFERILNREITVAAIRTNISVMRGKMTAAQAEVRIENHKAIGWIIEPSEFADGQSCPEKEGV